MSIQAFGGVETAPIPQPPFAATPVVYYTATPQEVAALAAAGNPVPPGSMLIDPVSRQIYGQSDGQGGYSSLGAAQQALSSAYWLSRGGNLEPTIQFRGATDTANALGELGIVVNAASDAEAFAALAAGAPSYRGLIAGNVVGRTDLFGPLPANIVNVYIGGLGLSGYAIDAGGDVPGAGVAKLTLDPALLGRYLLFTQGPGTNYAGVSGTGSARTVAISALAAAA